MGWQNEYSQLIRFLVLLKTGDFRNKRIVEAGCGYGDLIPILDKVYRNFNYIGIDFNREFIDLAKARFKSRNDVGFIHGDLFSTKLIAADYYLASGILSHTVENKSRYLNLINRMFEAADIGVGFNMLNRKSHPGNDRFSPHYIDDIYNYCIKVTSKVKIVKDYLRHDFTVMMYH